MSAQHLAAFEKDVVSGLASRAGLAAALLDAWSNLSETSVQSERSLVDLAQLGVTEERAAREVLEKLVALGLLEVVQEGFRPRKASHGRFRRIAFALNAIQLYVSFIHRDATVAQVVLTKPPRPSVLERKLSDLGWKTSELESTEHAFHSMVRGARKRVIVMTPFFDAKGAIWFRELYSLASSGVERILILRSLEDRTRGDYPIGYETIYEWLVAEGIRVFNYAIPRSDVGGRETFHAKVVLCDRNAAYLGSSNMNAASLEHSMEMGVALYGRAAADVSVVLEAVMSSAQPWS